MSALRDVDIRGSFPQGLKVFLFFLLLPVPGVGQQASSRYTYKETPQGGLDLVVTRPSDWSPADRRSAIIFFFGGAWTTGSLDQFERQAEYFATRGMIAVRAEYRVSSRHRTEPDASVEDGRSAVRWIREHAEELGVDPNRLVMAGGSSGGHVAACAAQCPVSGAAGEDTSVPTRPNALVLFNPVLDYAGLAGLPDPYAEVFGRFPGLVNDTALQGRISPAAHIGRTSPPTLLLFGSEDPLLAQGEVYAERMTANGVSAELYVADNGGHGFFNTSPWFERTLYRVDEFLISLGYTTGSPTVRRH